MQPLFLGSHPAIDFLNTSLAPHGAHIETIADGAALVSWLVAAGLLEAGEAGKLERRFGVKALDATAQEARKVREWARAWLVRWRSRPKGGYEEEIVALNKLLARETRSREVVADKGGFRVIETPRIEMPGELIALVAVQIAALLAEEDPCLVKDCAGGGCTLWFLDRTKAHRRRFCSATACGNRAKVAAFRSRQR